MSGLKINWHFDYRPGPQDQIQPLAVVSFGADVPEASLYFNHSRGFLYIEFDGKFGTLAVDKEQS